VAISIRMGMTPQTSWSCRAVAGSEVAAITGLDGLSFAGVLPGRVAAIIASVFNLLEAIVTARPSISAMIGLSSEYSSIGRSKISF